MEGLYTFFLESTFLGFLLYGEKMLGRIGHWGAAAAVWIGSWMSGYLIVATDAWMQRPVGYRLDASGKILLDSWWVLVFNDWAFWQCTHAILGGIVTASFVMAGVGAFYLTLEKIRPTPALSSASASSPAWPAPFSSPSQAAISRATSWPAISPSLWPPWRVISTPDASAPVAILGQPDVDQRRLDNPFILPGALSFLIYGNWSQAGDRPRRLSPPDWPDNIPLLYYSFHIMVGLGTLFILLMALAALQLWRGKLYETKLLLWALMLFMPLALRRQHRRLDHRRIGPPALADLRSDAHLRRLLAPRYQRQRSVHAARLHGHVHYAVHARPVPDLAHPRPGSAIRRHPSPRRAAD